MVALYKENKRPQNSAKGYDTNARWRCGQKGRGGPEALIGKAACCWSFRGEENRGGGKARHKPPPSMMDGFSFVFLGATAILPTYNSLRCPDSLHLHSCVAFIRATKQYSQGSKYNKARCWVKPHESSELVYIMLQDVQPHSLPSFSIPLSIFFSRHKEICLTGFLVFMNPQLFFRFIYFIHSNQKEPLRILHCAFKSDDEFVTDVRSLWLNLFEPRVPPWISGHFI